MKKFNLLLLAALAAILGSCITDHFDESSELVEITANLYDPPVTRSIINETDYNSLELDILWGLSESIGVYGQGMINTKFTATNKWSKVASPIFSGKLFSTPKYAYYPYSTENNSKEYNEVRGNLPLTQTYSTSIKKMRTDYKIATFDSKNFLGYKFDFTHILTFVRFDVNADGTAMEGEKLISVSMEINTPDGAPRQLAGGFTMDLSRNPYDAITGWDSPAEGSNKITLSWEDSPTLDIGRTVRGYITSAPEVKKGDNILFTITTDKHIATMSAVVDADYVPDGLVDYDLILSQEADIKPIPSDDSDEDSEFEGSTDAPVLNGFKFEVAKNPGKILSKKLYYDSASKTTKYINDITEEVFVIDQEKRTITAYIPYLNDRKLVPTFDIPHGMGVITKDGIEIVSGETEVDFSVNTQIAVVNINFELAIYDVILENTGLPVVVVNQTSGLAATSDGYWETATGTQTQPKDSDWAMSDVSVDNFMVYNADGTSALVDKNGSSVSKAILSSTRLRGNVSQKMPKKPFAVKLDSKHGILGMPAHKRWVLLANWADRTLMRNAIAYDIADIFKQTFPTDGLRWNPSGQFVELVYNGVHVGNYYLCEQIKIDKSRLDISEPYDKDEAYSGNPEGYGYLLECDDAYDEIDANKFMSRHYIPFMIKDDVDAGGEMLSYASNIIRNVEDQLYNKDYSSAYETLDMTSMIDFLLIQEIMMNGEIAHPKSLHMYLDGGKLYAGPIWDFDWETIPYISEINSKYDNAYTSEDYVYEYGKSMLAFAKHYRKSNGYPTKPYENSSWFSSSVDYNYHWYPMLVKDGDFKKEAARRWNIISGVISSYAEVEIPAIAARIKKSEAENWNMWKLESGSSAPKQRHDTYSVGGGFKGDEHLTFDEAAKMLTTNLNKRISGMNYVSNMNWPSVTITSSTK